MFSIITPTFNRKHTLYRVYESLINQSYTDFDWIIVDDFSSDNTKELVDEWISAGKINIEYHFLDKNQGKPKAVNFGLTRCKRPYTIIVDSDDSFVSNTLEDLKSVWDDINSTQNNIGAVWTLVYDEDNNIKGDLFPEDKWQVNFKQRVLDLNKGLQGDKWHSWRTKALQDQGLFSNVNCHIQESHSWNEINKKYDFLCLNIAHLTAHISEGSLITSKKSKRDLAAVYYYGGYYALKDASISDIVSYKYYRYYAFEYTKSSLFYSDKKLKLSLSKRILAALLFIAALPERLIKKGV